MLLLRQLAPLSLKSLHLSQRFYARKIITTTDANMKQVHEEMLRYISPHASIKVDSDIYVKVQSADPHKYPSGDALIAELHGGPVKNCTASMDIKISDDEQTVEIVLKKLTDSTDFHCQLAVPIKASLDITSRHAAIVKNTFGDKLRVKAEKFINTKDVRAEYIQLLSEGGHIQCQGTLLGKETVIETKDNGNITLDKLQGDDIRCKTTAGNITTNCSYVESSKFETDTGCLDLKNVHKKTEICVHHEGELKMTGVHGNLNIYVNKGIMNLQLSQLHGENCIKTNDLSSCIINISDEIVENTAIDINYVETSTSFITLDTTLEHLSAGLQDNKQVFIWPLDQNQPNKLMIATKNSLTLGKSSWMDMMRLQMEEKQNNKS